MLRTSCACYSSQEVVVEKSRSWRCSEKVSRLQKGKRSNNSEMLFSFQSHIHLESLNSACHPSHVNSSARVVRLGFFFILLAAFFSCHHFGLCIINQCLVCTVLSHYTCRMSLRLRSVCAFHPNSSYFSHLPQKHTGNEYWNSIVLLKLWCNSFGSHSLPRNWRYTQQSCWLYWYILFP